MEWFLILFDFIPLLVFVILDSLGKLRYAVLGAVLAAALELGYSYWAQGTINSFSLLFAGPVLVFAALSYRFNNPVFFQLKPTVIGGIMGIVFLTSSALHQPLLLTTLDRYVDLFPPELHSRLQSPTMAATLTQFNLYLGFGFLIHALVTAWAALRLNRWWWFAISGPGLYLIFLLAALVALQ